MCGAGESYGKVLKGYLKPANTTPFIIQERNILTGSPYSFIHDTMFNGRNRFNKSGCCQKSLIGKKDVSKEFRNRCGGKLIVTKMLKSLKKRLELAFINTRTAGILFPAVIIPPNVEYYKSNHILS